MCPALVVLIHYKPYSRERLRGKWGIVEVADAADSVRELGNRGLIDASRAMIRGGSAGS